MSVSYASNRVTIGNYKDGTTAADSTTNLQITSGEILAGDIGRFVAVYPSSTDSSQTQVRRITSVSGGTIGINSAWVGTIASGTTWRVSHNCADVHAIGDVALEKVGTSTYRWDADWSVSSTGFFADVDIALEMYKANTTSWPIASGGVVQFGVLYGGEANGAKETTNGCRLEFREGTSNANVYSSTNARAATGGVVNYYGCLIESYTSSWMFQRMTGPTRFIGCLFDGPMGGRFYHEASEWVDCRMSGNDNSTPAWSIGATFTRDIESVKSYRNLASMKSYVAFGGTLRLVEFSNNTDIFNREASSSASLFRFIDCTEFDTADTLNTGGVIEQYRSVIMIITDSAGSDLAGAVVRVNNSSDTTQGSIETSDANGEVDEILAMRYRWAHGSGTRVSYFPFRIRARKFGYYYVSLPTPIGDPIKQSLAMLDDPNVTQASGTASAHTGITVTDHGGTPTSWQSKDWGITVTGNLTTNSGLTADDIKHYLHYHLAQDATFNGKASGLLWHNLIPMAGTATERGDYGGTYKGVRVVDESGDPFPGITNMQSDDGTYYTPPTTVTVELTGIATGSRVRIETQADGTLLSEGEVAGTTYTYSPQYTVDVPVKIIVRKSSGGTKYQPYSALGTITVNGYSLVVSQIEDPIA